MPVMPDLRIKQIEERDLRPLERFLLSQDLGYPNYNSWITKTCLPELYFGSKKGCTAYANGIVIADVIVQPHKELPKTLEIKNMRVDKGFRRRDIAHFLMKQAEVYARQEGYGQIIADFRAGKDYSAGILNLILFCGFSILGKSELYHDGFLDYAIVRKL